MGETSEPELRQRFEVVLGYFRGSFHALQRVDPSPWRGKHPEVAAPSSPPQVEKRGGVRKLMRQISNPLQIHFIKSSN